MVWGTILCDSWPSNFHNQYFSPNLDLVFVYFPFMLLFPSCFVIDQQLFQKHFTKVLMTLFQLLHVPYQ